MKTAFLASLALSLLVAASPGIAQKAQTNRAAFRSGNWFVVHSTQAATGAVVCTGFYMGQPGVQLGKDSLAMKIPGEPKSVALRFDQEPARATRPAEKAEQQTGVVMLSGADFERLRRSKTLGLDVVTAQGRVQHALALEGLDAALKNIDAGCPLGAATVRADRAAQLAREKAEKARCAPPAIARMRENGVPEFRISADCPKAAPPAAR